MKSFFGWAFNQAGASAVDQSAVALSASQADQTPSISGIATRFLKGTSRTPASANPSINKAYLMLHQFQRNRKFVEVNIVGDDAIYQSIILELDPIEQTVLIDELFPRGFQGLPGQKIKLKIRENTGHWVEFDSEILENHLYDGSPIYVIRMPQTLDANQRRGAYRLPIHERQQVASTFITPDQQLLHAQLKNLSASGLCMEINGDVSEEFHYDDELNHVAFDFAGMQYDCGLRVRSVIAQEHKDKVVRTLIGAEFLNMSPFEERLLERSIMRYQRDKVNQAEGNRPLL